MLESVMRWRLPPSKSHAIRWMLIAAQSDSSLTMRGMAHAGQDILTCASALVKLGVRIEQGQDEWVVHGVGVHGLTAPTDLLDCGNSATLLRTLAVLVSRLETTVVLSGDASLRSRDLSTLESALHQSGVEIQYLEAERHAPFAVEGRWKPSGVSMDLSWTSQVLSAFILCSPAAIDGLTLELSSKKVSTPFSELSLEIAKRCACIPQEESERRLVIPPWSPSPPPGVNIPADSSLVAMAMLACRLHEIEVVVEGFTSESDDLGGSLLAELSRSVGIAWSAREDGAVMLRPLKAVQRLEIDLSENSDLLIPLAALMGIGAGGRIYGIGHARNKECDRLSSTQRMLGSFGVSLVEGITSLQIRASQPRTASCTVSVERDHRLQMVAALLSSRFGGEYDATPWYRTSHPEFEHLIDSLHGCRSK